MHHLHYNSRKTEYKSIFGAVKAGQTVRYRVFAPYAISVDMLIKKGDEGHFAPRGMVCEADGWFFLNMTFEETGAYFYHFVITYDRHKTTIFRNADGSDTTVSGMSWQQTVHTADFAVPDCGGGIMYQIFPDRFFKAEITPPRHFEDRVYANWGDAPLYANGTVGAVINNDYFGGNLRGIQQKLPYLEEMGVSVIYLNPIFEAHANHRYNTADYMTVDPLLGTNEDFCELCKAAATRGIKVILDGVFSHTGSDSVYFNKAGRYSSVGAFQSKDSPYYSWFKFANYPHNYHSWWGFDTLPEVNEDDPSFIEFVTGVGGVIDYWMNLGAAGFRLDVADELPDRFIEKIRTAVKRSNGILYGEVWEDASNKVSYGEQRQFLMGRELDSVMNYPFASLITDFVTGACDGTGCGVQFINGVMNILENYPEPSVHCLMNLLGTHDTERILTVLGGEDALGRDRPWQAKHYLSEKQWKEGERLLKMAAVLQYTLPGIPSVYYGDEIGTQGYRDPFNRTCFDWSKTGDSNDLLQYFKMLGKLRNGCKALKRGKFIPAQFERDYVSFLRVDKESGSELFVACNPSNRDVEIWLLPGWKDDEVLVGGDASDGVLTVPAGEVAILRRDAQAAERRAAINN